MVRKCSISIESFLQLKEIFVHTFPLVLPISGHWFFDIDSGMHQPIGSPPSQHFTIIFNTFVMMTLFNEINARKIRGERNIFEGLFRNPIFCIVIIVTALGQVLIVQFGGRAFSVTNLTLEQWLWCVFFGIAVMVWGQVLATIPKNILSKKLTVGKEAPEELMLTPASMLDDERKQSYPRDKKSGRILWVRGIKRLQTQVISRNF